MLACESMCFYFYIHEFLKHNRTYDMNLHMATEQFNSLLISGTSVTYWISFSKQGKASFLLSEGFDGYVYSIEAYSRIISWIRL
jgi:hypothetical protein